MSTALTVGRIDGEFGGHIGRIVARAKIPVPADRLSLSQRLFGTKPTPWTMAAQCVAVIPLLNTASIAAFNRFVAALEGLTDNDAMDRTTFKNLPWWLVSVWLPIDFDPPRELGSDEGDPVFVGSCQRLVRELEEIKAKSPISMGDAPADYQIMRPDQYRKWLVSVSGEPLTNEDTLRWIWRALRDGAELAMRSNAPMTAG
jgi:hypothetical protein